MSDSTDNTIGGGTFFSAVIQGRDITVQLPPQVHTALHGLPPRLSTFTGRKKDFDQLMVLLDPAGPEADAIQIVAVAGLGGVGKTELVLQTTHAALNNGWFPGGALFVDLFGYDPQRRVDPSVALEGMLRAAGIPGEHIPDELQDRSRLFSAVLAAYARQGREVLVVIDNASSSNQVRPLLPNDSRVLITSRHILADLGARLLELDVLAPEAAVNLLARRLYLARGTFDTRVADDPMSARAIADLCGGLPLALHIVAALLSAAPRRPLSAMASDLEDARTRLDGLRYGYGDDELAVRAAFDLSYHHLDQEQAQAFRLLTVNPGPDVSAAAASVIIGLGERTARQVVAELARASLISEGASSERWKMHDLVRLYASDRGEASATPDGRSKAHARLLDYYLTFAKAAAGLVKPVVDDYATRYFPDRNTALAWLDTEYPNLSAAARTAAGTHPHIALGLSLALADYLSWRRLFNDWISLNEVALQAAQTLGDRRNEANVLNNLGNALRNARRYMEAISVLQDAVRIFRQLDDLFYEARTLNNLGAALLGMRRFNDSITAHEEAISILQKIGDRAGLGQAFGNLGRALAELRKFDEAINAYQNAAKIHGETGDLDDLSITWNNIGAALQQVRRFDEAITAYRNAANIRHEIGDLHGKGEAFHNLAITLHSIGRSREAILANNEAVDIYRKTGDRRGQGMAYNSLGIILRETGQTQEAIVAHQKSVSICQEIGDRHGEATSLGNIGNDFRAIGRFQDAVNSSQAAERIFRELGDRHGHSLELINLGYALAGTGKPTEAIAVHQNAAEILYELGDLHSEGLALVGLAMSMAMVGKVDAAISFQQRAANKFDQVGDKDRHNVALAILDRLTQLL